MKSKPLTPDTYPLLLKRVRETLIDGQRRIEAERVRTYWETGRIIYVDILKHKDRAEYGKDVMERLEKDLEVDLSTLQRCVQFAKIYPRLPNSARGRNFSWSHYRHLITISDDKERLRLEKSIIEKGWTTEELAAKIKDAKVLADNTDQPFDFAQGKPVPQLKFTRGKLHTYQIIKANKPLAGRSPLVLDLGFRQEYVLPKNGSQFKEGDFVETNSLPYRQAG